MASILYDKFGGKYGHFKDKEKILLFSCVCIAHTATEIAYKASLSSFKGYNKSRLERYFGKGWTEKDLDDLSSSLCVMNNFFNDSRRFITFVDSRRQKRQKSEVRFIDVRYDIPSERNNEPFSQEIVLSPIEPGIMCFTRHVSNLYASKDDPPYEGANPRVYVNSPMLQKQYPIEEKAQCILHELTHVLLYTVDNDARGIPVYERVKCSLLAKLDPARARIHADAWGYFIIDFLIRPNDQSPSCTIS